jgi:hypothetical protein
MVFSLKGASPSRVGFCRYREVLMHIARFIRARTDNMGV